MDNMTSYMGINYGEVKPAGQAAGILSSDSPDTPFGFHIDSYSDFADDDTYGSLVVMGTDHSASRTHMADELDCEELIEFWENSWYGSVLKVVNRMESHSKSITHTAEHLSSHHYAASSVPSLPGSPRGFYGDNQSPNISYSMPGYTADYGHHYVQAAVAAPDPALMPQGSYSSQASVGLTFGSHLVCQQSWDEDGSDDASTGNSWKERKTYEVPPANLATSSKPPLSTTLPAPVPGASAAMTVRQPQRAVAGSEDDEEAAMAAAWKWRFCRRWKAEQVRAIDPKRASGDGDSMAEALAYLNAVGDSHYGDMGRTTSSEVNDHDAVRNSGSTFGTSSILGAELFADDSFSITKQNLLASAVKKERHTKEVTAVAKRAHQLLEQQQEVSRRTDERWKGAFTNEIKPWAGDFVDPVVIDDWGKYRFVLMRIKDKEGRQKVFVRGRNYCTEDALIGEAKAQVTQLIEQHQLPKVIVETQGAGVMEWRRDRDRLLEVHTPIVYSCTGASIQPREFNRLVGVLTKQHLPMHYKVTADGCTF